MLNEGDFTVSFRDHGDTDAGKDRNSVAVVLPQPFGRYEILRMLGEGGMGSVFLARDTQLQREVALKIPRLSHDSAEMRECFLREARAAAAVHHANLCPLYDVGEVAGIPYLTMRYITGTPLSERLRNGPPAVTDAVAWTRTIALALAEAHRRGLLHRDLKPGNILLESDKEPVVLDFGLARLASNEVSLLTQPGVFMGTRPYAAPEQVRGDVSAIGPPADVYSLGVIFYELLTGRRPFAAQNPADLDVEILTKSAAAPSSIVPGLDRRLDAVSARALAKNPADRYASMTEFAAAIAGLTIGAPLATLPRVAPPTRRRYVPLIAAAGLVATGLVVSCLAAGLILAAHWWAAHVPNDPIVERRDDLVTPPAPSGPKCIGTLAHESKVLALAVRPSPDGEMLLSTADDKIARLWNVKTQKLVQNTKANYPQPALAPDLSFALLAPGGNGGDCYYWDLSNNKIDFKNKLEGIRAVAIVRVNEKSQRVLLGCRDRVYLMAAENWAEIRSIPFSGSPGHIGLSPDARQFWCCSMDDAFKYTLQLWDLTREADPKKPAKANAPINRIWSSEDLPNRVSGLAFSEDRRAAALCCTEAAIHIWDLDAKKEVRKLAGHEFPVNCLAFSPDGKRLASGSADGTLIIWDVAAGTQLWKLNEHKNAVTCVAWLSDGRHLVSGSTDQTIRIWEVASL